MLRKQGIQLQRQRSWCVSTVEKASIQALERIRGCVRTDSGKIVQGMKGTKKRDSMVNLFAALEAKAVIIRGKSTRTGKRADS
jgi:transposase-like protein